jgi:aryl-alcohol dehydrogenase-like predicted oxidoreductase
MSGELERRRIGSLEVTAVGVGCNNFGGRIDERRSTEVVSTALDEGINFFDTADVYGGTRSEELLGAALGTRRHEVVVATKFGMTLDSERSGAKPQYVRRALEDSLRRLGTDHVDLYQLHQPDRTTPIADTLATLDEQVRAGKVREIGCSNFSVAQLREAQEAVRDGAARFVSVQNEYSLLKRDAERDVLPECERTGTAFIPYFPLASGVLTGKYRRGQPPPPGTRLAGMPPERAQDVLSDATFSVIEDLDEWARQRGHSILDLAFAWLLSRPEVSCVIAGATSADQVRANADAGRWTIDPSEASAVDLIAPAPG